MENAEELSLFENGMGKAAPAASTPGKAAYERLKKMQDERVARAQKMDEDAKTLENDINTKKLSLSEDKLTEMQKQLSDKRIAMQRYRDFFRTLTGR